MGYRSTATPPGDVGPSPEEEMDERFKTPGTSTHRRRGHRRRGDRRPIASRARPTRWRLSHRPEPPPARSSAPGSSEGNKVGVNVASGDVGNVDVGPSHRPGAPREMKLRASCRAFSRPGPNQRVERSYHPGLTSMPLHWAGVTPPSWAAERIAAWRMSTRSSAPRGLPPNNSMQLATLRAAADAGRSADWSIS